MNKKILITITSLIIIISATTYWLWKRNNANSKPLFKIENPIHKDMVQYINASGTLKAKKQITIGSLVAGRIIKILADNNDEVKKDQVLTILDDGIGTSAIKAFKAKIKGIEAKIEYYEKFYERQKQLFETEQISKDDFEKYTSNLKDLRAQKEQAEGELEIRQQEYDNLFIKSPADGIIIAKEVDLGQMITARFQATKLYEIAKNLKVMEAQVDVDEADVGMVKEGQEATFRVDSFPKRKFFAKVSQIRYQARIVDNVVTYATILDVDNPNLTLRPGMTTNVDIKVAGEKNALVVLNKTLRINSESLEAVAKKLDYKFERMPNTDSKTEIDNIWILEDGNKFKQIKVELGVKQGRFTQAIGDVNENTNIIIEVEELNRDNLLLKQLFSKPGTIGGKK